MAIQLKDHVFILLILFENISYPAITFPLLLSGGRNNPWRNLEWYGNSHILFNGFFLAKQNECGILQLQFSGFPFFLGQTGMKQYIFISQLQPGMVRLDDCQDIAAILESITVQIFQCQFFYNPFFTKIGFFRSKSESSKSGWSVTSMSASPLRSQYFPL